MKRTTASACRLSVARLTAQTLLPCLFLAAAHAADPGSAADAAQKIDVEVFHDARPVSSSSPVYSFLPKSDQERHLEGWVILDMMIDPKGKPYEVAVRESSGNATIESAALRAVTGVNFRPADSGGQRIDSSLTLKMNFRAGGSEGSSERFREAFKNCADAIEAGDRAAADAQFAKLEVRTLYEDAFRNWGRYLYDKKWGSDSEQLADLQRALGGQDDYLPKEAFVGALAAKFALEVKTKDYASALDTWKSLGPLVPQSLHDSLQQTVEQIQAIRKSQQLVRLTGRVGPAASWNGNLFKGHFSIAVASGSISEIKLRCKKQYVSFKYQPDLEYTVNPAAGDCFIELLGEPGTAFELNQS